MTDIFFGFGHGFGGTHLLAGLLNLPANVDCGHERKAPCSRHGLFNKFLPVYYGDANPDDIIKQERVPMINDILSNNKVFGEINGVLTFFIKSLYRHFPNAKFIHMVRDPRKQIISTYNTGIYDYDVYEKEKMWWWPYPNKNDKYHDIWENLTKLEKCSWDWYLYNHTILEELKEIPKEQVFFYKFEDMIKGKRFYELCDFLELKHPNKNEVEQLLSVKHSKTPVVVSSPILWEILSKDRKISVNNIVGEISKEIGYGELV